MSLSRQNLSQNRENYENYFSRLNQQLDLLRGDKSVHKFSIPIKIKKGAVVVAQLVERSLPIPEVRSSNPVIGNILFIYIEHLFTVNCVLERRK